MLRLMLRRIGGLLLELSKEPAASPKVKTSSPGLATASDDSGNISRFAEWDDVFLVIDLLEKHDVDYVLVGAYALSFNGIVRMTGDVDVLVADNAENNRRWINALSELPAGAVRALSGETTPFDNFEQEFDDAGQPLLDDEPGVIRVADEFVVDVMPKACGLTLDDLRGDILRVDNHGRRMNVLSLSGMRKVKQGIRDKDRADLRLIELALNVMQDPSAHAERMSRRRFAREPRPGNQEVRFQVMPAVDEDGYRLQIATEVIRRAKSDGDESGYDAETLALYCDLRTLQSWLEAPEPLDDLRAFADAAELTLPGPSD